MKGTPPYKCAFHEKNKKELAVGKFLPLFVSLLQIYVICISKL